jgi:hypothetical protein
MSQAPASTRSFPPAWATSFVSPWRIVRSKVDVHQLISSSLVLSIVDALCVTALFAWAVTQGVLPSLDVVPYLPSFDFAWFLRHETAAEVTLVVVAFALVVLGVWIRAHAAEFRQRVARHSPSSALLHGGSAPS